jgi:hypothetical protein
MNLESFLLPFTSIIGSVIISFIFIGIYKEPINSMKDRLTILENYNLHTEIAILKEFKEHAKKFIDNKLYTAASPLNLSEEGRKLIKDSGFETIFEKVKDELIKKLSESRKSKTKYDVQENSRGFMDDFSREEYEPFLPIKTYAFDHGKDYAQILRAGSILLRDYYLLKHPEIIN